MPPSTRRRTPGIRSDPNNCARLGRLLPGPTTSTLRVESPQRNGAAVAAQGDAKSQVGLEHERLPDVKARDEARAYWRERLAARKTLREG